MHHYQVYTLCTVQHAFVCTCVHEYWVYCIRTYVCVEVVEYHFQNCTCRCMHLLYLQSPISSGGTSGAALSVALKAAKNLKAGQRCVVIFPDSIRNYL